MRHCCEAIAICPTSLEMRPCMCTGRRVSARFGLDALIVVLRHPWSLLCTVLLTRLERNCIQHRSPSQPCRLLQRPCTTRARTLTPQRGGSLPGLEARQALHGTSENADGPAGSRPWTLPHSSLWRWMRSHDSTSCIPTRGELDGEFEELPDTSVSRRRKELLIFI